MTTFQSKQLTMLGLGNAASSGIDPGIHLRWNIDAALGFPSFGFRLFRRDSAKASSKPLCVDLLKITLAKGAKGFSFGTVTITCKAPIVETAGTLGGTALVPSIPGAWSAVSTEKLCELSISEYHAAGKVTVRAYDGGMLVAEQTRLATATEGTVTVRADRFDRVVITCSPTTAKIELYRICWKLVSASAGGDEWTPLVNLRLPRSWTEASSRIPSPVHPLYSATYPRLEHLIKLVIAGDISRKEVVQVNATIDATPGIFTYEPVKLLLFAASDPYIARMLGLYHLDTTAVVGAAYDYKVVGHWASATAAELGWICFGLVRGVPPVVRKPAGLVVEQRTLVGGVTGTMRSQVGVGMHWNIARSAHGLQQYQAIMYHITRAAKKPDGRWVPAVTITGKRPVIVAARDGTLPTWFYTDGPVLPNDYQYRVFGIDIWGRKSAVSTAVTLAVVDNIAPPPPGAVTATPAMQAGPAGPVTVSWEWTDEHAAQAGDAAQFRVYWQNTDLDPLAGTIGSVTDNGDGTSSISSDLVAGSYASYESGYLVNAGRRFKVTSIGTGSPVVITVENLADSSATDPAVTTPVLPKPIGAVTGARGYLRFLPEPWTLQGRFLLSKDWSAAANWQSAYETVTAGAIAAYSKTLADRDFGTSAARTVGRIIVGVSTVDGNGTESRISPPVSVSAYHQAAPADIEQPDAPTAPSYASRADYFGNSFCTITVNNVRSDYRYDLYRALDSVLLAADGSGTSPDDLDDTELATLADAHESVFVKAGTMTSGGTSASHEDTLKGAGRNRYVYKVQPVDAAGNPGEMSASLIVKLHDVTPPKAPVLTKVKGEQNQITVKWAASPNENLVGYELYRTEAADKAGDYRLMDLQLENATDAYSEEVPATLPAGFEYTDTTVVARTQYYYGLIAVRQSEEGELLRSRMSKVLSGQAYDLTAPQAPDFNKENSGWVYEDESGVVFDLEDDLATAINPSLVIRMVWAPGNQDCVYMVQRRAASDASWTTVMDWGHATRDEAGNEYLIDRDVGSTAAYLYRVKSRSAAGLISRDASELCVEVEG